MTTLNTADPKAYIIHHDKRVKELGRMPAASLPAVYREALAKDGSALVYGGPESRDEFVNAIIEIEYPDVRAAREAYAQSAGEEN